MTKKIVSSILIAFAAITLSACQGKPSAPAQETPKTPASEAANPAPATTPAPEATTPEAAPATDTSKKPGLPTIPPNGQAVVEVPDQITQIELILDASGSMAGQVGGKAKIDIAKDTTNSLIDGLKDKANLEVGLRIYGHLNKECSNTVLEFPIGKIQADAMKAKIASVKALGYTPITTSLEKAAGDFDVKKPGTRQIILVTDGIESCNGDPCAMAKKLKEAGVVTRIDVVGFNLKSEELKAVQCIAEPFGGKVIGANSAKELTDALGAIVQESLKFNLELRGIDKDKNGVYMNVKVLQNGQEVKSSNGHTVQFLLPEGTYDVQAVSPEGMGTVELKGVTVTKDKDTLKDILFVKTAILVNVIGADGKPLQSKDMCVFPTGETEKETKCAGIFTDKYEFTLEPGTYDIHAVNAATNVDAWIKGVEVKKGEEVQKTISFAQGSLKVNVIGADGKPLQSKDMCVFPTGETEKETACAGIFTDNHEFKLTPGIYDLHLLNAGTSEEKWVKGIEVKASETATQTVSFAQGSLQVNVIGTDGKPLQSKDMCVYNQGETENEVACSGIFTDKHEFKLSPGMYDLHLASGGTSEEKWVKGIEVKAAETATQTVTFEQGTLVFNITNAQGQKADPVYEMCVYNAGETENEVGCAGIYTNTHTFTLKPGSYDLNAKNYKTQEEKWAKGVKVEASKTTNQAIVY